jgi:hypothetical protein
MSADRPETIQALTTQLRQALHACSVHTGGPLVATDRCLAALADGRLTPTGFRRLGEELVRTSQARIAALPQNEEGCLPAVAQQVVDREMRMVRFINAVFGLDGRDSDLRQAPSTLIAVVGKGRKCSPQSVALGRHIGEVIGQRHDSCALVTGGLGGVMASAADGARSRGGMVVGLLPGVGYRTTSPGHADVAIDTGMPPGVRNYILVSAAAAVVAAPGSHGTWQEMITAVDLDKPVWAVGDHSVRLPGVSYLESVAAFEEALDAFLVARPSRGVSTG